MTAPIRVLVVEDSLTVLQHLLEVLAGDPGIQVVGQATRADEAIELCRRLRPDVMTLDMVLGSANGLTVTEQVMAWCPTPILIVSSSTNRGDQLHTLDALAAGAVDVLDKAAAGAPGWEARFREAVRRVARIKVITHPRARLEAHTQALRRAAPARRVPRVVAIGVSTGGPGALVRVLGALPRDYPIPILVVLHIGQPFGETFTSWLAGQVAIPVAVAEDGARLPEVGQPGVKVAPADLHLLLSGGRLRVSDGPERHSCRPSVDVLFESLAREVGPGVVACLLTGMGRDGASGLLEIRRAGGTTYAQDEATSVVFGMPREAIRLGAAGEVLPLERFAPTLIELAGGAP